MERKAGFPPPEDDPLWYKNAIIHELHVCAFYDSDGDGVGDFRGLIGKLDYLQDLGITAIWLLPFYPSPLKDDGYDISDFTDILPTYGKRQDFRTLVQEAHRRRLRVITELVTNPQELYLPLIIDPEYHYEAVNVENQQNNPESLLWWMKRLIALRKRFKAFGRGTLEFLYPENHKVLSFLRRYQDDTLLVVANLSHLAQHTSLNLAELKGKTPVEVFGQVGFPSIRDEPELKVLLDAYLLEKAVYELGYELNNRPDWVKVPLQGILQLMESD